MDNPRQSRNSPASLRLAAASNRANTRTEYSPLSSALLAGLSVMLAASAPAQTFTILHTFTPSSMNSAGVFTNNDGANPLAGLFLSGNTLYGTAAAGGSSGNGTVFALNTDGTGFTNLHAFTAIDPTFYTNSDGAVPQSTLFLSGNTLYGTAALGGNLDSGTVFALGANSAGFTNLYSFTDAGTPKDGLLLFGGILYGTTDLGGSNSAGSVFAVNIDGTGFTNLHSFAALGGNRFQQTNSDGSQPIGGLVLAGNTLYGTASFGGPNHSGTVFAVNTDGTGFTNLHSFTPESASPNYTNSDGANPGAGLILSGHTLYGTALDGGNAGNGAIFAINTDGTGFTNLYSFSAGIGPIPNVTNSDGAFPNAGLILSGHTLYGTATYGGKNATGTVFAINTDGSGFANLYTFSGESGSTPYPSYGTNSDGAAPFGSLILSGNTLYGTANAGGSAGAGTVFSLALPPALQLTVAASGDDITVSWPTNYVGYILQRSVNLGAAGWNTYTLPFPPVISNGQFVVTLPITSSQQGYYRLRSP